MEKIRVNLGKRSYDIIIGNNSYEQLGSLIKRLKISQRALVVTNRKLFNLLGATIKRSLNKQGFSVRFEFVPDSEKAKSLVVWSALIKKVALYGKNRDIFLIALGGGVIGDLTGFVASVYKRGVPYIQVPTTVLSQVDSAIGGKTGIDLSCGKNLVGSFYQPRLVYSEISSLKSLPRREITNGLSEIIKYGIIKSESLFRYLEKLCSKPEFNSISWQRVVEECSRIKAKIVEQDEKDIRDLRIILNFGHTIGHGIEAASDYSGKYHHGEAVALGMLAAGDIGKKLGITPLRVIERIETILVNAGLPDKISGLNLDSIMQAIYHDKKFRSGKTRMILPVNIGKVIIKENIPFAVIAGVLKKRMA